jgi:ribosomal protein L29
MKKTDKISYRQKSKEELQKVLADLKKQLVETRAKHLMGNQKDTSVFKKMNYQISFIETIINESDK